MLRPVPASTTHAVRLVCPVCRQPLTPAEAAWSCTRCRAAYPVISGILDLRVTPDPWLGLAEDREKAVRLEAETAGLGFEDAVRAYWKMTPGTPPERAERFVQHVLAAEARSRDWLQRLAAEEPGASGPWLDLGCGTGDIAAAAGPRQLVIGIDIAMRWLVLARKRPGWQPAAHTLVCCCAERLPLDDASVPRVVALGVLEHCASAGDALAEAARVLKPGGTLRLRTVNRFSLLPEPHVGLWGVGFLPRTWADAYVRFRGGGGYRNHRPLSAGELARALHRAGLRDVRVTAAEVLPSERDRMGGAAARLAPAYDGLRRRRATGWLLSRVAPILEARGTKP